MNSGRSKRKVRIFLLFLVCSFLAWLISNLSEAHTSNTTFKLEYSNPPDSLILAEVSKNEVDVKLKASGFKFLNFGFKPKTVHIDLRSVKRNNDSYYITAQTYKRQIDRQLSQSIEILDIDKDTVHFTFYESVSKEVPVKPDINMTFAQNYMQEDELIVTPNHITISGPKNEIDTIKVIETKEIRFTNLSDLFSEESDIIKPEGLQFTKFSANKITVSGNVVKFSEKLIEVPVTVLNIPEGVLVNTYPSTVSVLCKSKLDELKNIEASDFLITADYKDTENNTSNVLVLKLSTIPTNVYNTQLKQTEVEFILKKE